MLRLNFAVSLFVLGACALAQADISEFLARGDSHTWNSLVYADAIIPVQFDSQIPDLRSGPAATIQEFESLLADPAVLAQAYNNYKLEFADHIRQVPSSDLFFKLHEADREQVFRSTLISIAKHNLDTLAGKSEWSQGVNAYSHLTAEEFLVMFASSGKVPSLDKLPQDDPPNGTLSLASLGQNPSTKNWTADGAVTSIKNQGGCGSCYAFAALACLESKKIIVSGAAFKTLDLAEQEIVDCTTNGCNGGNAGNVYTYVLKSGIGSDSQYAYTGKKATCASSKATTRTTFTTITSSYVNGGKLVDGGETALASSIAVNGPATTVLNAGGWQNYKTGVFTTGCGSTLDGTSNHVILITGYTPSIWMIKNSWGTSWGMQGFMQLNRGNNTCSVSNWGQVITKLE